MFKTNRHVPVALEELQYFTRISEAIACFPIESRATVTAFHVGSLES